MRGKGREGRKEKKIQKLKKGEKGGACSKKEGEGKKKKRERKEGRKETRRGVGTNVAQGVEPEGKGPRTALREVGFLLLQLFYA